MPLEAIKAKTITGLEALDLNKKNYVRWNESALDAFLIAGSKEYVTGDVSKPDASDAANLAIWTKNDSIAQAMIRMNIAASERDYLRDNCKCTTANEIWKELEKRHRQKSSTQPSLLDDALSANIYRDEDMVTTANRVRDICKQIFEIGTLDAETLARVVLLRALCSDLKHVREKHEDNDKSTAADIVASLEKETLRLKDELKKEAEEEKANAALTQKSHSKGKGHTHGQNGLCETCGGRHRTDECWGRGGAMEGKRDEVLKKRAARREKNSPSPSPSSSANTTTSTPKPPDPNKPRFAFKDSAGKTVYFTMVEEEQTAATAFVTPNSELEEIYAAQHARRGSESSEFSMLADVARVSIDWKHHLKPGYTVDDASTPVALQTNQYTVLNIADCGPFAGDSGATVHVSPVREDFHTLHAIPPQKIWGVGGNYIEARGIGDIHIRQAKGATLILRDVLYVPQATIRLMSIGKICDNGYTADFDDAGFCIRSKTSKAVVATGTRHSKKLYTLNGAILPRVKHTVTKTAPTSNPIAAAANANTNTANLRTWHGRLGHIGISTIKKMAQRAMAKGMPVDFSENPPSCESCILGKQTRTPVAKTRENERSKRKLGVVCVDLTGPEAVESKRHNRYSMELVDEYTDMTWCIPLRTKDQAFSELQRWEKERKLECNEEVGIYRTDGGELKSDQMRDWLAKTGTKLQVTAPYTSAHNGIAERRHRTVFELGRAMMAECKAPAYLWDYFVETAGYVAQRRPTTYQNKMTPYEAWYGVKPNLAHLREIGCKAFVLIQNKHNPKIYDRSLECQLIGYSSNSKAYICYHRQTHRVVTSYHVEFIESHQKHATPLQPGRIVNADDDDDDEDKMPVLIEESDDEDEDDDSSDGEEDEDNLGEDGGNVSDPDPDVRIPRRSQREKQAGLEERIRKAVRESTDAGNRLRADREARKRARQEHIPNEDDVHALIDGIVLATLTEDENINLEFPEEPKSTKEALESDQSAEWHAAIQEELKSIQDMGVYDLVPRSTVPKGRKVMRGKFVFRTKRDALGNVSRYKARYVLRGFEMIYGKDYTKTTSPTARAESLRVLFHLAGALDYELTQLDVKTAYLYGDLDETTWMEQPKGFEEAGKEDWVWQLKKGLYGMKQGGRIWNKTMDATMKELGFTQLSVEHCIYYRKRESGTIFAAVHVDDFTVAASSAEEEVRFEEELQSKWQISRADANFVIGWAVRRDREKKKVYLSQKALIDRIIREFNCADANPTKTPLPPNTRLTKRDLPQSEEEGRQAAKQPYRQLVGVLMYLAISTRPDIMHAVSTLSRFNSGHGETHWKAALHVVKYLKGTRDFELELGGENVARLTGFTDSDYANCPDTRRSVSGYCFSLGSGLVSWMSKKQATTATSSTEAEYMAAAPATKEAVWIRNLLQGLNQEQKNPTVIFIDNRGARILTEDPSFHQRVKHIEVQHHYSRECSERGIVHFVDVPTKDNVADAFTKALPTTVFEKMRGWMGIVPSPR